ncbi:MAG: YciI family protein [Candidatus Binatus sp.]|uniref:YciI family protein n=1 Tax=Candidatus Binatus sp. TaxID=2811406 RepID=UPI003BB112F7
MRYLCAVYLEPKSMEKLSPAEGATLDRDSIAYDDELRRSGHYIVSDALQRATTAKTLRVRNGKLSVTDGPFAETKEQLGGFILVEASNMDEAVELASKIPMAKYGTIEVRPIMDLSSKSKS